MANAETITQAARLALCVMVEFEERRAGSHDLAIEAVANTVRASSSWVKKFISKSAEVKEPRITLFMNIRAAYETVCARVEQEQENEQLKRAMLLGELHEATAGFERLVDRSMQKNSTRAATARGR